MWLDSGMQVICKALSSDSLAILDISSLDDVATGDKFSFWQLEPNCKGGCKRMNQKLGEAVVKNSRRATDPGVKSLTRTLVCAAGAHTAHSRSLDSFTQNSKSEVTLCPCHDRAARRMRKDVQRDAGAAL